MKSIYTTAVLLAAVLSLHGACIDVLKGDAQHKCKFTADADGTYIVRATANARDGKNDPWIELRVTIEDQQCAREKISWHDNNVTVNAVGVVELTKGVTYVIDAKQTNHHATAAGVTVEVAQEKPLKIKG